MISKNKDCANMRFDIIFAGVLEHQASPNNSRTAKTTPKMSLRSLPVLFKDNVHFSNYGPRYGSPLWVPACFGPCYGSLTGASSDSTGPKNELKNDSCLDQTLGSQNEGSVGRFFRKLGLSWSKMAQDRPKMGRDVPAGFEILQEAPKWSQHGLKMG